MMFPSPLPHPMSLTQALTAELNMYESKIQEYKSDNQVLINQLQDIKKKYLSLKQQQR